MLIQSREKKKKKQQMCVTKTKERKEIYLGAFSGCYQDIQNIISIIYIEPPKWSIASKHF